MSECYLSCLGFACEDPIVFNRIQYNKGSLLASMVHEELLSSMDPYHSIKGSLERKNIL